MNAEKTMNMAPILIQAPLGTPIHKYHKEKITFIIRG